MMTVGEQRHAAVVENHLRRIADALEKLVKLATDDCAARANGKEADHGEE